MNNVNKIILGIDPGTASMGYGIISYGENSASCVEYGVLKTSAGVDEDIRLSDLYNKLEILIRKHKPQIVSIEDIFYFKNQKTLIGVSQARGIALLAAAQSGIQCHSFTPLQIKQAVTGYGQADKEQVQKMVKTLLSLEKKPKPDDAADALAVAICCAYSIRMLKT
jgi:crossover junction endodeoxyribonuclease RuvC